MEMDDEPITSSSNWNHTTSYTSAAQPLPTKRTRRIGRKRRDVMSGKGSTGFRIPRPRKRRNVGGNAAGYPPTLKATTCSLKPALVRARRRSR